MTTNLDTLATALYVRTDDLLKESPQLAPCRPEVGIDPKLGDAELVTLAVMQALLGFTSEAQWLRHRDFISAQNWITLTDTLTYLKRLGVNAIEVLPFCNFEGFSSWGYNP